MQSIEVAKVIYEKAGGACDRTQLAAMLNYSGIRNGSFLTRVAAAKMFGLIEQDDERLKLSVRGSTVVSPVRMGDAERVKVDAFLSVELFKKVYEEFHGQMLPPEVGLRNLLLSKYKVVADRVPPTVKIMLDSAEEAGFFKTAGNRSRMIMPILSGSATSSEAPIETAYPSIDVSRVKETSKRESENLGENASNIHPAILGLLKELPPAGTAMSQKKRAALIGAFTATVGFIYPDLDTEMD